MIHGLDLFSGIGGISLALSRWIRTVAYCEIDLYCQSILLSRMRSGDLSEAPIWDDVRNLKKQLLPEIDIITGGFPCQDISVAGAGAGLEGERSGLFFQILRLAKEIQPVFVFLENVPAIRTRGASRVCKELAAIGYDCRWDVVSAEEIGACHRRQRWFLLAANSECLKLWNEQGRSSGSNRQDQTFSGNNGQTKFITNANSLWQSQLSETGHKQGHGALDSNEEPSNSDGQRLERSWRNSKLSRPTPYNGWKSEPILRGRDHGVQNRMDRIKGLGNAVVPMQAQVAFKRLMGFK